MMTAVPQHFCLVSEVAWDNTQDIHCSVIYIAQVLVLMDNVDGCPFRAWLYDEYFADNVHDQILVDDACQRQQAN